MSSSFLLQIRCYLKNGQIVYIKIDNFEWRNEQENYKLNVSFTSSKNILKKDSAENHLTKINAFLID